MNRPLRSAMNAFAVVWAIILIFDAWGGLHVPNPFAWDRGSRMFALYTSMSAAVFAYLWSSRK